MLSIFSTFSSSVFVVSSSHSHVSVFNTNPSWHGLFLFALNHAYITIYTANDAKTIKINVKNMKIFASLLFFGAIFMVIK